MKILSSAPRIISRIAFSSDYRIEGIVTDVLDSVHPRFLDISIDGHYFGTELACGVIDARLFNFADAEDLALLKTKSNNASHIAGSFKFETPNFVDPTLAHHFEIKDRGTGKVLFDETRTLREDFYRGKREALSNVVLGGFRVVSVIDTP